ncbi:hypothetical protein BHE74_00029528 [Ensete ventricosum]|nr:hypothetical protein BHE74_00029528 [Ensete ventricosum]RZS19742.1 hypothetical protein BHM03_00052178 [Ensete ventricosum]
MRYSSPSPHDERFLLSPRAVSLISPGGRFRFFLLALGEERGDVAMRFLVFLPTGGSTSFSSCGETNEATGPHRAYYLVLGTVLYRDKLDTPVWIGKENLGFEGRK